MDLLVDGGAAAVDALRRRLGTTRLNDGNESEPRTEDDTDARGVPGEEEDAIIVACCRSSGRSSHRIAAP